MSEHSRVIQPYLIGPVTIICSSYIPLSIILYIFRAGPLYTGVIFYYIQQISPIQRPRPLQAGPVDTINNRLPLIGGLIQDNAITHEYRLIAVNSQPRRMIDHIGILFGKPVFMTSIQQGIPLPLKLPDHPYFPVSIQIGLAMQPGNTLAGP